MLQQITKKMQHNKAKNNHKQCQQVCLQLIRANDATQSDGTRTRGSLSPNL